MKITFLGTSAANAFPEAFCRCENCTRARALGGRSLRKRSSALVNDDLLIDLGPDIHAGAQAHRAPLTNVSACLQTHAHADHLDTSHLLSRSPAYGVVGAPRLHLYASAGTLRAAAKLLERDCEPHTLFDAETAERFNLTIHTVAAFQSFDVGAYRATAFPAVHDDFVESLLYAVETPGGSLFYGTDTATLTEETWAAFHERDMRFDVVILDHTYGPDETTTDHLGARTVTEIAARLREEGLLAHGGRVLGTHIAHEGNPPYPELAAYAAAHGYEVAYDGLIV